MKCLNDIVVTTKQRQIFEEFLSEFRILCIIAPSGFGKTFFIKEILKDRDISYLSMKDSNILEHLKNRKSKIYVFDDILSYKDKEIQLDIRDYIKTMPEETRCIFITRTSIPGFLKQDILFGYAQVLSKEFFLFDDEMIEDLLIKNRVMLRKEEIKELRKVTKGAPIAVRFAVLHLVNGDTFSASMTQAVMNDILDYFDKPSFFEDTKEYITFLTKISFLPYFTSGMVDEILGISNSKEILQTIQRESTVLSINSGNYYELCTIAQELFQRRAKNGLCQANFHDLFMRGAVCYEKMGDYRNAIELYEKCKEYNKISNLLIKNAHLHPGNGHYFSMEQYYRALPEEKILHTPELTCGMSMLESLLMRIKESERWYGILQEYYNRQVPDSIEQKEAKRRLLYLDIALPHRGIDGITEKVVETALFCKTEGGPVHSFCVTGNMPSLMNGGKDFSKWVPDCEYYFDSMKEAAECILGADGVGMPELIVAEAKFERGEENYSMILTDIAQVTERINQTGTVETLFAGIGLRTRIYMAGGDMKAAVETLLQYRERVIKNKKTRICANLDALFIRMKLLQGRIDEPAKWLAETEMSQHQNEYNRKTIDFYIYITEVLVLISQDRLMEASTVLGRLLGTFVEYERIYCEIEAKLLLAIIHFRMGEDTWKSYLEDAVTKAETCSLVHIIAVHGNALLPLFKKYKPNISKDFLVKVMNALRKQSSFYPHYLYAKHDFEGKLTGTEARVLDCICKGMSNSEISDALYISLNTVKYHIKNIYSKLHVNTRSEAMLAAKVLQ